MNKITECYIKLRFWLDQFSPSGIELSVADLQAERDEIANRAEKLFSANRIELGEIDMALDRYLEGLAEVSREPAEDPLEGMISQMPKVDYLIPYEGNIFSNIICDYGFRESGRGA